jgi:16S rRNA (guanine966-N2)-methyltransferase
MRITSGRFKGRVLNVPDGAIVRPTSDKVRQAIFNMLLRYGHPNESCVIDGFAGSGALGLEALSRGARFVQFFDIHPQSLTALNKNISMLGVEHDICVTRGDVTKPGKKNAAQSPADLVFLDPPYGKDLVVPAMRALTEGGWVADGALFVIESEAEWQCPFPFEDQRVYGDTQITFSLCDHACLQQDQ